MGLTRLMEQLRLRGGLWSVRQEPDADPATVAAAWRDTTDPFAMLLLLAALHPPKNERVCDALVAAISFFEPMRREAQKQALARPGMNYNGPDRFRFLHLAQRLRNGLAEDASKAVELSAAIRSVVPDPYSID